MDNMTDFIATIGSIPELNITVNKTLNIEDEIKNITKECSEIDKKINNIMKIK
jgi:hypothetical protein